MSRFASRPVLLNLLTIAITVVLVAIVLVVGRVGIQPPVELVIGQPSPQDYIAPRSIEVPDEIKTEEQRVFEENNVPAIYARDTSLENRNSVQALFDQIRKVAPTVVTPSEVPTTTEPPPDQTEPPVDGETTTVPPEDPGPTTSSTSSTTST